MLERKRVGGERTDDGVEIRRCKAEREKAEKGKIGKNEGKQFIREFLKWRCFDWNLN